MSDSSFLSSILLSPESKRRRFGEPAKFVPVLFVWAIIASIYTTWVFGHCLPMLQSWTPPEDRDRALRRSGIWQCCIFHCLTGMLVFCYGRSMLCHPGEIPDDDVQWNYIPQDTRVPQANSLAINMQETKRSGDRRHCKWCSKYKPDRCHHCRACRTCVLRMDHHCPWIYNCVGYRNYKYFFLLLFYCVLDLHFIFWSMLPTIKMCFFEPDLMFVVMFGLLFCATLSAFLGCLVSLFWCFHVWLMLKALTTIEFCEKSLPKNGQKNKPSYDTSVYNLGFMANITTVLGENPLLWLLPMAPPSGDGLNYVSDQTRLTTDMDAVKGIRRKGHQRVQRYGAYDAGSSSTVAGGAPAAAAADAVAIPPLVLTVHISNADVADGKAAVDVTNIIGESVTELRTDLYEPLGHLRAAIQQSLSEVLEPGQYICLVLPSGSELKDDDRCIKDFLVDDVRPQ